MACRGETHSPWRAVAKWILSSILLSAAATTDISVISPWHAVAKPIRRGAPWRKQYFALCRRRHRYLPPPQIFQLIRHGMPWRNPFAVACRGKMYSKQYFGLCRRRHIYFSYFTMACRGETHSPWRSMACRGETHSPWRAVAKCILSSILLSAAAATEI